MAMSPFSVQFRGNRLRALSALFLLGLLVPETPLRAAPADVRDAARKIVAAPDGGVFAGRHDRGAVEWIHLDGSVTTFADAGPLGSDVIALAAWADGGVAAAGRNFLFTTDPSGKVTRQITVDFSIRAIATGADGYLYLAGNRLIRKLDRSLSQVWQSRADMEPGDAIRAIAVSDNGFVFAAGRGFVSRLSPDGDRWISRLQSSECDASAVVVDDASGAAYLAGTRPRTDPRNLNHASGCAAKIAADTSGVVWSASVGGGRSGFAEAIAIDRDGTLVVAGSSTSTERPRSGGFAARLSADGSVLQTQYFGAESLTQIQAATIDRDGRMWVAGWPEKTGGKPMAVAADWNRNARLTPRAADTGTCVAPRITVTSTADSGSGSLRQAVADICEGGLIDFSLANPSTITLTSGSVRILKPLAIIGPGASSLTINGGGASAFSSLTLRPVR